MHGLISASWVLGLQVCTSTPKLSFSFKIWDDCSGEHMAHHGRGRSIVTQRPAWLLMRLSWENQKSFILINSKLHFNFFPLCYRISVNGESPKHRSWHTLTAITDDKLFLFGGLNADNIPLSKSIRLSTQSLPPYPGVRHLGKDVCTSCFTFFLLMSECVCIYA